MHGLQLWLALPEGAPGRSVPRFAHHETCPSSPAPAPRGHRRGGRVRRARAPPARSTPRWSALSSPCPSRARTRLPLELDFEYAALTLTGTAEVSALRLQPGSLLYLGRGHRELAVHTSAPAQMFLIGGVPFDDPLVMWWNFVARSHEEIVQAREDWMAGRRFGRVLDVPTRRCLRPSCPRCGSRPETGTATPSTEPSGGCGDFPQSRSTRCRKSRKPHVLRPNALGQPGERR